MIDAAGFAVMAPVVPAISNQTGAGPGVIGTLVTAFAVGQLVAYPLAGVGIQRRGPGFILAVALVGYGAGDLMFAVGDGLAVYFPARVVQGFAAGAAWMGVVFAIMERFPGQEYRRLSGVLAAYSIGAISGAALGATGGIGGPFLAHLGLVALAGVALILVRVPSERMSFRSDRSALRSPGFMLSAAGIGVVAVAIGTLDGPLPLHFGTLLSQAEIAALYIGVSVLVGLAAVVAGRLPAAPMLVLGAVLLTSGLALAGITDTVPAWIAVGGVAAIGFGMAETGSLGTLLAAVGPERMVLAMVVWSLIFGLGYVAGPALAGAVAETVGFDAIGIVPLAGTVLVLVALAYSLRGRQRASIASSSGRSRR